MREPSTEASVPHAHRASLRPSGGRAPRTRPRTWPEWRRRALATAGLVAATACVALGAPAHAAAEDPWLGPDKALQFGLGFGVAAGGYALGRAVFEARVESALFGFALSVGVTGVKELLDYGLDTGTPSARDLAWGVVGAGLGIVLAWLIDLAVHRDEPRVPAAPLVVHGPGDAEVVPLLPTR